MKTPPSRSILVSYDFSARCREAWRQASALAERLGCVLEAVHVRDWLRPDGGALRGTLTIKTRRELEARMEREIPGPRGSRYHVLEGPAAEAILALARRVNASLVVLPAGAQAPLRARAFSAIHCWVAQEQ